MGHIILKQEFEINPQKIEIMLSWPPPTPIKDLRGFLGSRGIIGSLYGTWCDQQALNTHAEEGYFHVD